MVYFYCCNVVVEEFTSQSYGTIEWERLKEEDDFLFLEESIKRQVISYLKGQLPYVSMDKASIVITALNRL